MRFPYGNSESPQIDFPKRPLGENAVRMHPVILPVVAGKVLDGCPATREFLYPARHGCRHDSAQQRVLGIVFKVSPAKRIPVNIHARCQPECHPEVDHFRPDGLPAPPHQFRIPGLRQHGPHGQCRTELIAWLSLRHLPSVQETIFHVHLQRDRLDLSIPDKIALCQAQACRSVCQNNARHPQCRRTVAGFPGRSRHRTAGRPQCAPLSFPRIADDQCNPLLLSQLFRDPFRFPVRRRLGIIRLRHAKMRIRQNGNGPGGLCHLQIARLCRFPLGMQLFQGLLYGADVHGPLNRQILTEGERAHKPALLQGHSQVQPVQSFFKHPSGYCRIIRGQCIRLKGQFQPLPGSRLKQAGLGKGRQPPRLLLQFPKRKLNVQLHHCPASHGPGIFHPGPDQYPSLRRNRDFRDTQLKVRIGKSFPETITNRNAEGIKIAVTHVDPLGIPDLTRPVLAQKTGR